MTLYVKLSAEYPTDDEFIEAGPMAELLYIRGLCFCKRKQLDGRISTKQLGAVAYGIPNARKLAATLVDVGLWVIEGDMWLIPAWFKWNKSAAEIEEDRDMRRRASLEANHAQHHIGEGKKPSPKCELCRAEGRIGRAPKSAPKSEANRTRSRLQEPEPEPEPEEEPEPEPEQEPAIGRRHFTGSTGSDSPRDDDERVMRICERIVALRMDGVTTRNPNAYASKALASVIAECTERIIELAGMFPDAPDTAIAAAVHSGETRSLAAYAPQPDNVIEMPAPPPEWVRNRTKPTKEHTP